MGQAIAKNCSPKHALHLVLRFRALRIITRFGAIALKSGTLSKTPHCTLYTSPTMNRHSTRGVIRPKISTMPRQKSEPAAFLNIYKLEIEKKRLQEELHNIEERRGQIIQRLLLIDQQVAGLEGSVQSMRQQTPPETAHTEMSPGYHPTNQTFDMLFLDY
jgi:hypothetical protein